MRFVVAGLGFGEQHLEWLTEFPEACVAGLYVRTPSKRCNAVAAKFGVDRVSSDLPWLIEAADADALVVVTPPKSHAALLHIALDAGLYAISDKPLTTDLDSAKALVDATRLAPDRGIVTFQWRQHPGVSYIRNRLLDGSLGSISHAEIRFHHEFLARRETISPWRHKAEESGAGALGDQGVHLFDLLRYITAEEWDVRSAHGHMMWAERPSVGQIVACNTEDVADVVLQSASGGRMAFVHASRVATGIRTLQIRVYGTEGTLDFNACPDSGTGSVRHLTESGQVHTEIFKAPSLNPYGCLLGQVPKNDHRQATFADGFAAQRLMEAAVTLM